MVLDGMGMENKMLVGDNHFVGRMTMRPKSCVRFRLGAGLILWLLLVVFSAGASTGAADAKSDFTWAAFLGPFHTVILHYPIGFVTLVLLLEIYLIFRPQVDLRKVVGWITMLTAGSAVAAASLGWLRATNATYDPDLLERHRWAGLVVAFLTVLMAVVYWKAFSKASVAFWRNAYRACLFGTFGVLVVTAHFGGSLTHGSNYLTENAPHFVKQFMGEKSKAPSAIGQGGTNVFFASKIAPIFEAKCVQCHGPEKQKGKFRLDTPEKLLAGGSSGKTAVKPGEPQASELIRLVTLPRDQEDAMPPEGKTALTGDEVLTLMQWIYSGAKFD